MTASATYGIPCPRCECTQHRTLETRQTSGGVRRIRKCKNCGHHFTTYERVGKEAK
jgi:transcriptional regulator NrdR family protein